MDTKQEVTNEAAEGAATVSQWSRRLHEWVLVSCRASLTAEDDTSPTQDPEPSQPASRHAEFEPEPTVDDEPEPRATEPEIATEPEPYTSDQVREPATATATGECNREQVRAMESPAHCTTAGGELEDNFGDLIDFSTEVLENNSGDLIDFFTEISTCHDIPACMEFPPPSLFCLCQRLSGHRCPLTAPLLTLSPPPVQWARRGSGSFHRCQGWRIPHLRLQPQSPELRLGPPTLRLHHGSQRPRLHRLPSVHQLHRAPSSFRLCPGRSSSLRHLRTLFLRLRLVTPSHRLLRTPPSLRHSLHPLSLRLRRGSPSLPWSPEPRAPPWPFGSSVSPWIFGSPSPPRVPPPAAPPPSVGPLESSALPPPWLLPPSAPPWVVIMAAVWVSLCFSCSGSLLFSPWLLPPSSPPWTMLCLSELSVRPWPPELPDPLFGGGRNVTFMSVQFWFLP
ncbi:Zinc metalloprotease ZmpB [Labeo rohita]|uniref:Zinc metalloprotease ZmpB n=1 Tax=Labeo rohita TaxID=84645 RepID=A0ABQ8L323_LABRO|nr:Zinc metalloprotease ZmpB [Labeo rohita]